MRVFFFFQAEDGIRDLTVTGVQTCALPIFADSEFVGDLLWQRTLSLLFEGHRYPDYRRFGRLAELSTLGQDGLALFTVAVSSVLPSQECDARARVGNPGGIPLSC